MKNKKLFKYRIKLLLNYLKTVILFEFFCLWLFLPGFAGLFLSKIKLPVLSWMLGTQCLIMVYFNFRVLSEDNCMVNKWFIKLESERNDLRYHIWEEKNAQKNK